MKLKPLAIRRSLKCPIEFRWLYVVMAFVFGFSLGVVTVIVDVDEDYGHFLKAQSDLHKYVQEWSRKYGI